MSWTFTPPESQRALLWRQMIAEAVGTYFLTFFGTGSVAAAVLTSQFSGLWGVVSVWGFGATLAIYASAAISGAHLNPAVSFALLLNRPMDMPLWKFLPYVFAQWFGGLLAGCTVLATYNSAIYRYEQNTGGKSIKSAMMFGMYFPNPNVNDANGVEWWQVGDITALGAFGVEAFGTAVLMFLILALTDSKNTGRPQANMAPFFIGFTISCLMALYAPLTQGGFNPARDFGPRVVAALGGWGALAIPGPGNGFWVYICGPMFGAPWGAFLYTHLIGNNFARMAVEEERKAKRLAALETTKNPIAFSAESQRLYDDRFASLKEDVQMAVFKAVQKATVKKGDVKDIKYDDIFSES